MHLDPRMASAVFAPLVTAVCRLALEKDIFMAEIERIKGQLAQQERAAQHQSSQHTADIVKACLSW